MTRSATGARSKAVRRNETRRKSADLTVVDLFCGAGGLSEGFRNEGFTVLGGNDHDPDAVATYAANFPGAVAMCGDIRNRELRDQVTDLSGGADVIVGGPPCQAFSQVRNHTRIIDDPRNSLYREFVQAVANAHPDALVMENVPGMAQMGVQEQVVRDLELDGEYTVNAQLVDAADFGVPQTRKRLLFFGTRRSLGLPPPVLQGTGATSAAQLVRFVRRSGSSEYTVTGRPDLLGENLAVALADPEDLSVVSAAQAIGDLVDLEPGRRDERIAVNELMPVSSAYQRLMRGDQECLDNVSVPRCQPDTVLRLKGIPPGGNYRDLAEELQARYLTGNKWGPHNGSGRLGRSHYYAYRRLHPDIWAWTLNTKGDSVYHYSPPRPLSVREFARLQSFPDRFVFTTDQRRGELPGRISGGSAHARYRQAGNAVPPLLAAAAAAAVRDAVLSARSARAKTA